MRKPVLGIQLEFGFHEIKKYIHSGFAEKLSKEFDLVWFMLDKNNPDMETYFKNTGFPVVKYAPQLFAKKGHFCEVCNASVRSAWMKKNKLGMFHNYKKILSGGWKDFILGNNLAKKILEHKTVWFIQQVYVHQKLKEDFRSHHVDCVLSTGYASSFAKYFYTTAHQENLKVYHLVNSWKDLYTNNFIGFDYLDGLFVWHEEMKRDYVKHMPYLKESIIKVTGNPTFDAVVTHQPKPRAFYESKYVLQATSKWLLYTMMPPGLVPDEWDTILRVAAELDTYFTAEQVQLIIRKNPNHLPEEFTQELLPKNMILAEHYCTFDPLTDMIVQSKEGEQEWLDLVHHATLNLSVPSTVTMEFLSLHKAVINIGFDASGRKDERIAQHFDAGFYRNLFDKEFVYRVDEIEGFIPTLQRAFIFSELKEPALNLNLASDKIIQELKRG